MLATLSTQPASHDVVQQAGAAVQIRATQPGRGGSSQPDASGPPVAHRLCAHAAWLGGHARLPQTVRTSAMHDESQLVLQQ